MAIDEQRVRQSLHARLADTLGADEAALLMDYLQHVGWADVATKRDLDALRSDLHAEIADLKSSLLMWLVPTVIGSVGLSVTLSRVL
jgi:hypothetical protein